MKQPERIALVGTSCSGKTTLARRVAAALDVPHVELDALHWEANWQPCPPGIFRDRVADAVRAPRWVVEGNYEAVRDLVWQRATTVVWLNYPFRIVFPRAVLRTIRRIVTREELFGGNRETLAITDPEWIPWWVIRTHRRRRREYPALFARPENAHLDVHEFRRRAQADAFVTRLAA